MLISKMRITKILLTALALFLLAGCTCKPHKRMDAMNNAGGAGDNIDSAADGGPLKDINFAFDSYALDGTSKSVLQTNAEWLKQNPSKRVIIEGHCDERGTNEYNMVLGANRARAGQEYLRSLGIPAQRMSTVSYGEEVPLDPGHDEAAWAKNRRDHFKVE
jgi:peptidoglycan-associated lipoprotein